MKLKDHDVLLVLGVRGSGKTYWTIRQVVKKARRVIVFDPHGEYPTQTRKSLDELALDASILDSEHLSLSVVPEWRTTKELAEQFAIFCDLAASCENLLIVVDECGLLTRHGNESVEYVACQSRHWGAPLCLVAQRAVQISKTAREQASIIVSFRQVCPDDIDALIDRCGESASKVKGLPRREHWCWCEADDFIDDDDDSTSTPSENKDMNP